MAQIGVEDTPEGLDARVEIRGRQILFEQSAHGFDEIGLCRCLGRFRGQRAIDIDGVAEALGHMDRAAERFHDLASIWLNSACGRETRCTIEQEPFPESIDLGALVELAIRRERLMQGLRHLRVAYLAPRNNQSSVRTRQPIQVTLGVIRRTGLRQFRTVVTNRYVAHK